MSIRIDRTKCVGCGKCAEICPGNLIALDFARDSDGAAVIDYPEECWGCAACLKICRFGAIAYYLGADIGGKGAEMRVEYDQNNPFSRWIIQRPGQDVITITVDRGKANSY